MTEIIFFMIGIKKKSLNQYGANTENLVDQTKSVTLMDIIWGKKNHNEPDYPSVVEQNIQCIKIFYDKNNTMQKYNITKVNKNPPSILNKNKTKKRYTTSGKKIRTKKYAGSKSQRPNIYNKKMAKHCLQATSKPTAREQGRQHSHRFTTLNEKIIDSQKNKNYDEL